MAEAALDMVVISGEELRKHRTTEDCWIAVHSKVYDVTEFLEEHPGGAAIILKYAGADATQAYDEVHAPGIIHETLVGEHYKGQIDPLDTPKIEEQVKTTTGEQVKVTEKSEIPHLSTLLSVADFEVVAQKKFSTKTFAFYSSAATDLISHRDNLDSYRNLLLRPRVLRNVKNVSIKRRILGYESSAPFFVSPAAMAKLAHPDGELAIARACAEDNIIQIISNNASYPLQDIVAAGKPGQIFFLQLYVNSERQKTEQLLNKAREAGIKAIFVTVDAPIPGKREADERISAENFVSAMSGAVATNDKKGGGLGRVMAQYIDSSLNWEDLAWIKKVSGLPVFLKGVQTAADAKLAVEYGCAGVLLSNHGGRSLDTVQPAIVTLLEIHKECPEIFGQLEIYVDGGIRRGTDILKTLALGATAVGVGRPYLYSLAYGKEGVQHLTEILKDELECTMKLAGITNLDQANPGMVNTTKLEHLIRTGGEKHPWIKWEPRSRL
ncbi:Aldolase-type TIM barrel [Penicillium occitanis (nom. inval.)]|nr:hypothetical protein PENOC_082310 [Penicillium occitanis (nom. inval.)]PCG99611.1 Aldolase-type TIM barrel [Penicillium occitanis (nom. inval.)]